MFGLTFGFIIPWLFGCYLLKNDLKTLITIGPVASLISFAVNDFGVHIQWWSHEPAHLGSLSLFTSNVGLFPIVACFMIHFVNLHQEKYKVAIFISAVLLSALEGVSLVLNKVNYTNGWNFGWTFISYILSLAIIYRYNLLLIKTVK
ncbi:hypothetical protein FE783_03270 [Paenibacillus mesophilus]|uniref:CBO0543 family protein n=1 Tax=Paenibacillus mesophilus TaxID=2582849 RepID=UPI00110D2CB0|nr:CBO0543 family protein [Paenibacillus mesophilus]TMV51980.1 hypothetical protein FE783_03270 [Paenibacillus mesophilus]